MAGRVYLTKVTCLETRIASSIIDYMTFYLTDHESGGLASHQLSRCNTRSSETKDTSHSANISVPSLNPILVKKDKGKGSESQKTSALLAELFSPGEGCYTVDATIVGNIGRFLNVRIMN